MKRRKRNIQRPSRFPRKRRISLGPVADISSGAVKKKKRRARASGLGRSLASSGWLQSLSVNRKTVTWFLLFLLVVLIGVSFSTTDIFHLKANMIRITTKNNSRFDLDVAYAQVGSLTGRNTLFLTSDEVFNLLASSFPHLRSVQTSVRFPDGLNVVLESYEPVFRTQIRDGIYDVMQNGSIIGSYQEDAIDIPFLQIVGAPESFDPESGFLLSFAETSEISGLLSYIQSHDEVFPRVRGFLYYYQEGEIHIISDTRLMLSFDTLFTETLASLSAFVEAAGGKLLSESYTYLDLRVADRVYACPADERVACQIRLRDMYGEDWDADWNMELVEEVEV